MALVRIEYVGPHWAVLVPSLSVEVKRGESVEVSEEAAAGLLEQDDNWRKAEPAKSGKGGTD